MGDVVDDMKFPITQDGAEIISGVCADDSTTLRKWIMVKNEFVRNKIKRMNIKREFDNGNQELAILETFEAWISTKGSAATLAKCVEIFKRHELNLLVEKLEERVDEIRASCAQSHGSGNSSSGSNFGVPFGLSDIVYNFTGRKTELEKLHELITREPSANHEICCYTLLTSVYGLGGIGKTTLARKYILEYGESYFNNHIYWIEAESHDTLRRSFLRLARYLKIAHSEDLEIDEVVKNVYDKLADNKCLFVFDNVEEYQGPNGFSAFLPSGIMKRPYLLMTSRNSGLVQNEKVLRLDVLSQQDALELIKKVLPEADQESCTQLNIRMNGFPLALQLSLACIRSSAILGIGQSESILTYLEEYDKNALELHTTQPQLNDGYKQSIYLTWHASMDKIRGQPHGQLAELALRFMAYLNADNIQYKFLFKMIQDYGECRISSSEALEKVLFNFEDNRTWKITMPSLLKAVNSLEQYSIIALLSSENGAIKIHRFVQDAVRLTTTGTPKELDIVMAIAGNIHEDLVGNKFSDQCVLHGNSILPYYEKFEIWRKLYPNLTQMVSSEWRHINLIKETLSCNDQDAIRLFKVLRVASNRYRVEHTERTVSFIKCFDEASNPIDTYIRTFEELYHNRPTFKMLLEENPGVSVGLRDLSILLHQIKNPKEKLTLKLLFEYVLLYTNRGRNYEYLSAITKYTKNDLNASRQLKNAISTLQKFGFIKTSSSGMLFLNGRTKYFIDFFDQEDLKLLQRLDDFSGLSNEYYSLTSETTPKFLEKLQLLGLTRITLSHINDFRFTDLDTSKLSGSILSAMVDLARAFIIYNLKSFDEYLNIYRKCLTELTRKDDVWNSTQNLLLRSMKLLKILTVMDFHVFSKEFIDKLYLRERARFWTSLRMLELFGFIIKSCPNGCNIYCMDPVVQEAIRNEFIADRSGSIDSIIEALRQIQVSKVASTGNSVPMCSFCWNKEKLLEYFGPRLEKDMDVDRTQVMPLEFEALFHAQAAANQSSGAQLESLRTLIPYFSSTAHRLYIEGKRK